SDVQKTGNYILAYPAQRSHVHVPLLGSFGAAVPGGTTRLSSQPSSECHHGSHSGTHPRACRRRPPAAGLPDPTPPARAPRLPPPSPSPPPGPLQRLAHHRLDRLHPLAG